MRTLSIAVALVCAASLAQTPINRTILAPPPKAHALTPLAAAMHKHRAAIVHVYVEVKSTRSRHFKFERPSSGCVVSDTGLVVTHWDLIKEILDNNGRPRSDRRLRIQLQGGKKVKAALVARDGASGLALIKPLDTAGPFRFVELADSAKAATGEEVGVLSFHDGKGLLGFSGVLARPQAHTRRAGRVIARSDFLLTDAVVDRRSHGGALLDRHGRLLGICDAEHVQHKISEPTLNDLKKPNFGIVIPTRTIQEVFTKWLPQPLKKSRGKSATAAALTKVHRSIVGVRTGGEDATDIGLLDPYATARHKGLGSGVLVSTNGLILTNAHLVSSGRIQVTLHDGKSYKATLLGSKRSINVALIKIEASGKKLTPAALTDASKLILGETVIGVGNPFGNRALTPCVGVVSAKRGGGRFQLDPTLGNHNGGGPIIDLSGKVVGIVDGGAIDKIDKAFMMRGDDAKVETGLSIATGMQRVREMFPELKSVPVIDHTSADVAVRTTARRKAVQRVAATLLNIYVSWSSKKADEDANPFAVSKPRIRTKGLGSGVIIDASGLALTNWHVVDNATDPDGSTRMDHVVHARRLGGKTHEVEVLSISRENDLALLQLKLAKGQTVPAMEMGDSSGVTIGEPVFALGNPHGRANTITAGVVSALDQAIRVKGRFAKLRGLIETDTAINGGNSGGPLVDLGGRLVGINSAGGKQHSRTSYAIAINLARSKVLDVLLSPEKLRSVWLGMAVGDDDGKTVVRAVEKDGPAARAGVAPGDLLLALDGEPVRWRVGFALRLRKKSTDKPIRLRLARGGKRFDKKLTALSHQAWGMRRQTKLETATLSIQNARKAVTDACIARYRKLTGDPDAQPQSIDASLVRIVKVHDAEAEVKAGDLLLAVEKGGGSDTSLITFPDVTAARRFFNARENYLDVHDAYVDGKNFRCWVFRGGEIEVLELHAKRVML